MSQPVTRLRYDEHIALYTQAAMQAVRAYAFEHNIVRIEPVSCINNLTFKVYVTTSGGAITHFALRMHRPGEADEARIRSELRWLMALQQDTQLKTPRPVLTTAGALVSVVTVAQCAQPLYCVLFEWLDGRFLHTSEQTPPLAWQVGRFVGALHQHSQRFSSSTTLVRRHLDADGIFDWQVIHRLRNAHTLFTDEHVSVFLAVNERVQHVFTALGRGAEVFGLIHADLIWKNYFFHEHGVGAVDFDSCGWGYYLYDLAPTLLGYRDEPEYLTLCVAFLAGYRSVQPLPEQHEQYLNTLLAARHLVSCCWLAKHLDHPDLRQRAHDIVDYRTAEMQQLLDAAL